MPESVNHVPEGELGKPLVRQEYPIAPAIIGRLIDRWRTLSPCTWVSILWWWGSVLVKFRDAFKKLFQPPVSAIVSTSFAAHAAIS
jgi:hypothetical protein